VTGNVYTNNSDCGNKKTKKGVPDDSSLSVNYSARYETHELQSSTYGRKEERIECSSMKSCFMVLMYAKVTFQIILIVLNKRNNKHPVRVNQSLY
jgi:hypothetical protein